MNLSQQASAFLVNIMAEFKDKYAMVGRPKVVSKDKTTIPATSPSRSLNKITKPSDKVIKVEIRDDGYMILDFSKVIGLQAKISRTRAIALGKFIINTYERRMNDR